MRAVFYGLGADGTVGANKNSIKIIGEETDNYAQGYFVYDSKKSGSVTVSHLRFGPRPIRSPYLIERGQLRRLPPVLVPRAARRAASAPSPGATFLLNSPYGPDEVWDHLPRAVQETIIAQAAAALRHRRATASRARPAWAAASTRSCRPASSRSAACCRATRRSPRSSESIEKTYGKRGEAVVREELRGGGRGAGRTCTRCRCRPRSTSALRPCARRCRRAGAGVRAATSRRRCIAGEGDRLPVSALPVDGTYPDRHGAVGEAQHRATRSRSGTRTSASSAASASSSARTPSSAPRSTSRRDCRRARRAFKSRRRALARVRTSSSYTLQVAPEDCTGCGLCVEVCPVEEQERGRAQGDQHGAAARRCATRERANWDFFLDLPEVDRATSSTPSSVKDVQLLEPLFEFSGACAGCGETPTSSC